VVRGGRIRPNSERGLASGAESRFLDSIVDRNVR